MKKTKFLIFCSLFSLFVSTKDYVINPGPDAYENLQEAMILMNAGDSILIKVGIIILRIHFHLMLITL